MPHLLTQAQADTLVERGTTPVDLARIVLASPDLPLAEAGRVLWERTPFPMVRGVHELADALAELRPDYGLDSFLGDGELDAATVALTGASTVSAAGGAA